MTTARSNAAQGRSKVEELDPLSMAEFAELLPSASWIHSPHEPERFGTTTVLGVRSSSGVPAVVAIVRVGVGAEPARLIWLAVGVAFRGRSLATRMIDIVEQWAVQRGIGAIAANFIDGLISSPALWRIFERAAWEPPRRALIQYAFAKGALPRVVSASERWLGGRPLPPGFQIVPWSSLSADTLREVESRAAAGTIPQALSPFVPQYLADDPDTSVALINAEGAVLGWMINLRIGLHSVLYDRLFMEPSVRGLGASHALVASALAAQWRRDGDDGLGAFRYHVDNREMAAFAKRRLGPFAETIIESYAVEKVLLGEPESSEGKS